MKPTCSRTLFPLIQDHIKDWSGCTDCGLSDNRINPVFYRGHVPCTLLFVGDFPDESANSTGLPFPPTEGLPGITLDAYVPKGVSWACTYLTLCPSDDPDSSVGPADCWKRLMSFIELANPAILCTIGKKSDSYLLRNLHDLINKLNRRPVFIRVNSPLYSHKAKDVDFEIAKAKLTIEKALNNVTKLS